MSDREAKDKIRSGSGMYVLESLRNYDAARANGSTPKQAFDFVKNDLKKRGITL